MSDTNLSVDEQAGSGVPDAETVDTAIAPEAGTVAIEYRGDCLVLDADAVGELRNQLASALAELDRHTGWPQLRERVLSRDDHRCQFCGLSDREHTDEYGAGLHVHHIVPRRSDGRDLVENLITVCQSCHNTLEQTQARGLRELAGEVAQGEAEIHPEQGGSVEADRSEREKALEGPPGLDESDVSGFDESDMSRREMREELHEELKELPEEVRPDDL